MEAGGSGRSGEELVARCVGDRECGRGGERRGEEGRGGERRGDAPPSFLAFLATMYASAVASTPAVTPAAMKRVATGKCASVSAMTVPVAIALKTK